LLDRFIVEVNRLIYLTIVLDNIKEMRKTMTTKRCQKKQGNSAPGLKQRRMSKMDTKGTKLFDEMTKLVEEYGITAVTSALFDKVESNENWRQMDTLKETIASRM